jgi:aspartyl-tRNA(Asn)/glutamyl-tRNA(Gln) amidotransferase subunit A
MVQASSSGDPIVSYTSDAFASPRERLASFTAGVHSPPAITLNTPHRGARHAAGLARNGLEPADGPLQCAVRAIQSGQSTSAEVVESALAAIARHDTDLHGVVASLGAAALQAAGVLDVEYQSGSQRGPLHGIPFSVKDNIDVAGVPTLAGSDAYYRLATHDADAVALMRAAGGIPIAKVATHEFALGVTTPQARHPLDTRRIPGGSSGGGAISIATGMALATLATDTRASIRVPAALCGVVGYKPTFGWLPRGGVVWLSWTMDHVGLLTGTVGDAAYVADALLPGKGLLQECRAPISEMRIGVPRASFYGAAPAVATAVHAAIQRLGAQGACIVDLDVPTDEEFELSNTAGLIVSRGEAVEYHRSLGTDLGRLWPETADQLRVAEQITLHEYLSAQRFRSELAAHVLGAVQELNLDALVMPTTVVTAPLVEEAEMHFTALSRNAIPWSFIGWPVVSVPCGGDEAGLPIGLQVVAPPDEDSSAFRVARSIEAAMKPC